MEQTSSYFCAWIIQARSTPPSTHDTEKGGDGKAYYSKVGVMYCGYCYHEVTSWENLHILFDLTLHINSFYVEFLLWGASYLLTSQDV